MSRTRLILQRLLILVGFVAVGLIVYSWLLSSQAKPRARPPKERGLAARVIELAEIPAIPRAIGYGIVEAKRDWQAIAEVGGEIVELTEGVEVGRVVQEGTLLFRIEPRTYEIEKTRTAATVKAVRAQIDEIKAREKSARASLKVEERVLELARQDLARTKGLYNGGNAPLMDVDNAERTALTAEKAVQAIRSTLLELPASRKVLGAQLEQMQAGVQGAQLSLAKTEVVAPFTMRIRELNVGLHQAVSGGEVVLVGDGIEAVEIPAQMPVGSLGPLMPRRTGQGRAAPSAGAADGDTATADGAVADADDAKADAKTDAKTDAKADAEARENAAPSGGGESDETASADAATPTPAERGRGRAERISALVRLENHGIASTWEARYRRILGVDPITRTVGVVVEVDEPRRRGQEGPPLVPGLHVEVELRGEARPACLAIPRSALHGDRVWVVDDDARLVIRTVTTVLVQEDFVCLGEGVTAGESVVLTDLTPAVDGMLLAPRPDEDAAMRLRALALGEEAPQ